MRSIYYSAIAFIVFASMDMETTVRGITNGTHDEANMVALFFQSRFGLLEGMVLREILIGIPLAGIGAVFLWKKTKSYTIASLPVWGVASVHLIATINNIL